MNSSTNIETSLSISTQETPLLPNEPPTQPRIKNLNTKLLFVLRILIVLVVGLLILYTIYSKNRKKPKPLSPYAWGLSNYYCHLTPHPKLCRDSMSSVTNATALEPDPALILSTSLQLVIAQFNHTTLSITKPLTLPGPNASLVGPGLSTCKISVHDSLSRLDKSMGLLGTGLFYYEEDHNITDQIKAVKNNSDSCLLALHEISHEAGVEKVKLGVEKASRLLVNFMSLFDKRWVVIHEFYSRYNYHEDAGYNSLYNYFFHFNSYYSYYFDYGFLVCLFTVMYLFIALLYFLFWQ